MNCWRSIVIALSFVVSTNAADPPGAANREAMKKLNFLAGKWAGEATIETGEKSGLGQDTIVVRSESVKEPVAVRFAWSGIAQPNLVNQADLPASPFRTDDFPITTGPKPK